MSRQFDIVLEYDGENPARNTFLCKIDNLQCSVLRDYEDLYYIGTKFSEKKNSIKKRLNFAKIFRPATK
jgi:hypothetical protein